MKYRVRKTDKNLIGEIRLSGSKSLTNRVLIIKALCKGDFKLKNYSTSDDSNTLYSLINSKEKVLNAKDGGTTFRFLAAYLSIHEGELILTGSDRLIDRPIGPLIEALVSIGADIQYLGKTNYPPILITGKNLKGNKVSISSDMSSQFISALLLIAPRLKKGLIIKLMGDVVSRPYIAMTLSVMKHFGISYEWSQNIISIPHQDYTSRDFKVEADWSAASYYYEMAAFSDNVDLKLFGLHKLSAQGDCIIADIMKTFGVSTTFIDGGIHLTKNSKQNESFNYDFTDCPDLAQTLLATCAGLNVPAEITGITNLQVKETNRIKAMQNELKKLDVSFTKDSDNWKLNPASEKPKGNDIVFDTYKDHRMAMCLTSLAIPFGEVIIDDPLTVTKSYPEFWDDIKKIGFEVETLD